MKIGWKYLPAMVVGVAALSVAFDAARGQGKEGAIAASAPVSADMPPWVRRGLPGAGQASLAPLAGT